MLRPGLFLPKELVATAYVRCRECKAGVGAQNYARDRPVARILKRGVT